MYLIAVLIPPSCSVVEGVDALADKIGVFGGEFLGIKAGNDADEREVAIDVVAPMVLPEAKTEYVVKLCLRARLLDMNHHMGLTLLVQ